MCTEEEGLWVFATMLKTPAPRVPSGADGGVPYYVVEDIMSGSRNTVSIGLVEVSCRLRVFPSEGYCGPHVDFTRETTTKWTCTHQQQRIHNGQVKQSHPCTHAFCGSGSRIQSLIDVSVSLLHLSISPWCGGHTPQPPIMYHPLRFSHGG